MIINANTPLGAKVKLHDMKGSPIKYVKSYNTETKEAEIYVMSTLGSVDWIIRSKSSDLTHNFGDPAVFKGVLEGSYLELNSVRITDDSQFTE